MADTAAKKTRGQVVIPAHWLPPPIFPVVQIPRAVWSEAYWGRDWAHLAALAQLGQNGLILTRRDHNNPRAPEGFAWLREGVGGVAVLYHQNWT